MRYGVEVDLTQVKRMHRNVRDGAVKRAASKAMNRAIDAATTAGQREISAATKIPVRVVRTRLRKFRASPSNLIARLQALPFSPSLSQRYFRPTQNKKGVAASAWERRKTYKGAFMLPSGRVVTRTGRGRFPLKGLRGPSVPSTFVQERVISKIDAVARQTWRSRFDHEMARELKAMGYA